MANIATFAVPITGTLSVGPGNFHKDNTPKGLERAADLILKAAAAGVLVGSVIAAPPIGLAIGLQIAAYSGVAGTVFPALFRLFGINVSPPTPAPVIQK